MLLSAAAGLSLVTSTAAYTDRGEGLAANTFCTQLPGVIAQAEAYAQNRPVQTRQGKRCGGDVLQFAT